MPAAALREINAWRRILYRLRLTGQDPERVVRPVGVGEDYFKRVQAMEFSIANDDGHLQNQLREADIVLIGVSRSGKTPLSMYLGYLGYKTANIPLVPGIPVPQDREGIEAALMLEGTKASGRDAHRNRTLQGFRVNADRLQVRAEHAAGFVIGMADIVAEHVFLTGDLAYARHGCFSL